MLYLINLSRHHNVEMPDTRFFHDVEDPQTNLQAQILLASMNHHFSGLYETMPTLDDLVEAMRVADNKDDRHGQLVVYEDEEKIEKVFITFWFGFTNVGFGLGETIDDTSKSQNVWVTYMKWTSPEELKKTLMTLSKEYLAEEICQMLAVERCGLHLSDTVRFLDSLAEHYKEEG
jgi:hypothetical protein